MTAFFLYDGDDWSEYASITDATAAAEVALSGAEDTARFDREWPEWTDQIAIYEGFAGADPSEERLTCVLRATQVDVCTPCSDLDEDNHDSNGDW